MDRGEEGEAAAQVSRLDEAVSLAGTTSQEAKSLAVNIAIAQLWNMTSPSITFRADGTFSISQMEMSSEGIGGFEITDVDLKHTLTPENGYVFDNTTGEVITPQGEKLVISTFD